MAKWMKYVLIFVIFSMSLMIITHGETTDDIDQAIDLDQNFNYVNQIFLESSRYTQKDLIDQARLDLYHDDFDLSFTPEDLASIGFEEMFDTDELTVYFEKDSFSMMVYNKETGYLWSSRAEYQGISGVREDNTHNRNLMNSGLWVSYVRSQNVTSSTISTESLYALAEASYQTDGAMTETNSDPLHPYLLEAGSYSTRKVSVSISTQTSTMFKVLVDIKVLDIKLEVDISLIDGVLSVYIPVESIEEYGDIYQLLNIQIFPYLGAMREDKIPGYFMIPDGVGALIRTDQAYDTYFQTPFYGADYGYQQSSIPHLSVPIYGMVHAHSENGYLAEIEMGAEVSTLYAQFWGANTKYHRIGTKYNVRQIYRYIINQAGDGNEMVSDELTQSDFKMNYYFLSDDQATYTGMATTYRNRLIDQGILSPQEKDLNNDIPIQMSYIMTDVEKAFIGENAVVMSTPSQVSSMYDYFKNNDLINQQTTLFGWSKEGFVNQAPYKTSIKDDSAYEALIEHIKSDQNTIYFDNDYVRTSELSSRVSYTYDVAKTLSKLKMETRFRSLNAQITEIYYLYPEESYLFAKQDQSFFDDLGLDGLYMNTIGYTLFSYYDRINYERNTSLDYYKDIATLYDNLVLSYPNAYFYEDIVGYLDMPITNAQYDYYTDLVPILPIILKGSLSYYTPYLNFNAMGEDRLLTMVDFGINPSYILTYEDTYEMRYTNASVFYTTTFEDYDEEIVETYHYLNDALKHVSNAYITNREVLDTGLVQVTYSNDVIIYVNYTFDTQIISGQVIEPRDYKVVL